ncbi:ArsR/SmtB family transcription factor [Labedaea rhizosphaerae]|uniref:ArsR/SmtB family transcription factor n=1 Tax=Labedaea rhizosphaerae TaxID=598644 RepID=UPI001AADFE78|nr:DUF5937 family protein [Labedaea rhizosphaerae]
MIRLRFDLGRVRFACSPLWEAVTSVRRLAAPSGLHRPWLAAVQPRLDEVTDMDLLTTVIRPAGYLPDFLHPVPMRREPTFEAQLATLRETDPERVSAELAHLAQHPVAMPGPGRAQREAALAEAAAAPEATLDRLVAALAAYWRVAIEPHWPSMRALLHADLTHRLEELAAGGVRQVFRTLHPSVRLHGEWLHVVKYYDGTADLGDQQVVLIPCVFAWPDVLVRTAEPSPALTYAPRGVGKLWESRTPRGRSPLAGVLGATRAAILTQLDLPMATDHLAVQLDLAAPTVNVHLKALQEAGLLTSRRAGRHVLYRRTELGDQLCAAASAGQAGSAAGRPASSAVMAGASASVAAGAR